MPIIVEGFALYYDPTAPYEGFWEEARLVYLIRGVVLVSWVCWVDGWWGNMKVFYVFYGGSEGGFGSGRDGLGSLRFVCDCALGLSAFLSGRVAMDNAIESFHPSLPGLEGTMILFCLHCCQAY